MRRIAFAALPASLLIAGWLGIQYREMGGPGDQLVYFEQAAHLIPFVHNYYGPAYFVALRVVHSLLPLDWFSAGKVLSFLSLAAYLLVCSALFGRILGDRGRWLALVILALNPEVVQGGYEVSTNMYGAVFVLVGIWLTARARVEGSRGWAVAGLVFGVAYLTRFAAAGFLLGALLGVWFLSASLKDRLRITALLAAGAAVPVLGWMALLLAVQGYVPANYNFIHLALAIGQFPDFFAINDLIGQYGSFWGLLQAHPTLPISLATYGTKELIKFPFTAAFSFYFVLAGFLIPGLLVVVARRENHAPWLGAFLVGLFITGLAGRDWGPYYLSVIPFGVILIVAVIEQIARPWTSLARGIVAAALTILVGAWTVGEYAQGLSEKNWAELAVARSYLERQSAPGADVVSSTAKSLIYGSSLAFVDQSDITRPGDSVGLVDRLREHGVTHLVVTQRHTLFEFPELRGLLADTPRDVPDGLQRDTLITSPRRLAIYRVLPDTAKSPPAGGA